MTGPKKSIIPARAVGDPRLRHNLLRLLICYGVNADAKTGLCRPSRATVAKLYGKSIRTVSKLTGELVAFGYLERTKYGRGRVNLYRVVYDSGNRYGGSRVRRRTREAPWRFPRRAPK